MSQSVSVRRLRLALLLAALAAVFVLPDPASAQDTSLTPSADDPDVAVRSEAIYTITFTGEWTTTVTPGGLPGGAHFSRLIGGVHNDEVVFLESGEEASFGVEHMAEVGNYDELRVEINAAGPDRLSIIQGTSDSVGPTATVTFSDVTLTTDHPRVTLVTRIAPSPDWFVGVSSLSMLDSSGAWKASFTVDLYPWDVGTEEGTEFSRRNISTTPKGVITSLQGVGKFNSNKIATLTFTRESVLPTAPTIDAVHPGDEALTVVWTAPSDVTGITAYDLRWILTSANESVDSNWRVQEDIWTEGRLHHVLTGLANDSGYDVQVRVVTETEGSWSTTVAGVPAEPGGEFGTAAALPLGVPLGGRIKVLADSDYYEFTLATETGVILWTSGDYDTVGTLYNEDGDVLHINDEYSDAHHNFRIWDTLAAGTYYLKVVSPFRIRTPTGFYRLHTSAIVDSTGISDANQVEVDVFENGLIDPAADEDYFQFTLDAETDVILRADSSVADTVGELLDNNGTSITENDDGFVIGRLTAFLIRRKLAAGTYYVKFKAFSEEVKGLYSFLVETVTEPGSTVADALSLDLGELGAGRIDPSTDADYFKIDLSKATHVLARAVSSTVDIDGALLDSDGNAVATNVFEEDFLAGGPMGFTLADRLGAGTYYLKVTRSGGESTGGYAILVLEDEATNDVVNRCSALTTSFSDPLFGCQWNLRSTGQLRSLAGQDIRVAEVWAGGNLGAGIAVAVVDDGLHESHPDLTDNVDRARGHDYTTDGLLNPYDSHGTRMAGIIAARDNDFGGRGVAPQATIFGYNVLRTGVDSHDADAMTRNMATTAVSSNSWGPEDGPGVDPAPAAWEAAIDTGVETGYGGKGVVYVWAAGNGAPYDNSNFDGYVNYYGVTAVCAVDHSGLQSVYSESGANLWVCAPSNEGTEGTVGILTTENYGRYRDSGGTSAATATASGVVALVRAANTDLTWRDVKLILAASARQVSASREGEGWSTGAPKYGAPGNYNQSHSLGFGVVNAKAAVDLAASWENLPPFIKTAPVRATPNLSIPDAAGLDPGATVSSTVVVDAEVEFIEFVEVVADFETESFRDLTVELVSPSNTVSTLAYFDAYGVTTGGPFGIDPDYRFGSARHLGEKPAGTWTLRITDRTRGNTATLKSWSVKIYGHRSTPRAPSVSAVTSGRRSLDVFWTAPTTVGASEITTYDVRHIRSDAADKADKRWKEDERVWASGALTHTVTGLLDGTTYDVQVRAVNAKGDGDWSDTELRETLPNREPLAVGSLVGPDLQVGDGNEVVEVSGAFEDPDDDTLTYGASSSAPAVAGASISGSRVRLTPVAAGTADDHGDGDRHRRLEHAGDADVRRDGQGEARRDDLGRRVDGRRGVVRDLHGGAGLRTDRPGDGDADGAGEHRRVGRSVVADLHGGRLDVPEDGARGGGQGRGYGGRRFGHDQPPGERRRLRLGVGVFGAGNDRGSGYVDLVGRSGGGARERRHARVPGHAEPGEQFGGHGGLRHLEWFGVRRRPSRLGLHRGERHADVHRRFDHCPADLRGHHERHGGRGRRGDLPADAQQSRSTRRWRAAVRRCR